ncbi:GNAT family N-acetyltransferase [Brachybacterium sp. DNPG3]
MPEPVIHRAPVRDIPSTTLYLLAKLRQDVFTMEQGATDPDLDGRDLEEGTTLLWIEADGVPAAHIRVMREADGGMRIGRLAVAAAHRRDGFGGRIMRAALDLTAEVAPEAEVSIDAQAYLEQWYVGMGYETVGPPFLEAGIEHVPMVFRHPKSAESSSRPKN